MNSIVKLKQQFLCYLENTKGRSKKTLETYDRSLTRFFEYTKVNNPADITNQQVQKFHDYLKSQAGGKVGGRVTPMKPQTHNHHFIALRAFLKYLALREIVALSPQQIKLARLPASQPHTLSSAELSRLLMAPPIGTVEGKRDRAILELLTSTGMRIAELCALSIADIDIHSGECVVDCDGKHARVVTLPPKVLRAIVRYRKHRTDTDEALFIRHGRKAKDGGALRLSSRAVQRLLKHHAAAAGILSNVTPQILRHSLAIQLLSTGVEFTKVQTLLGHLHAHSTKRYSQVIDGVSVQSNRAVQTQVTHSLHASRVNRQSDQV